MKRVYIYGWDDELDRRRLEGWFDRDHAEKFGDATQWDGDNMVSVVTNSEFVRETLYRTAKGRWAILTASRWEGGSESWHFVDEDLAHEWLLTNGHDAAAAKHFGKVEEERGPGRPEVGAPINIRLDPDLLGRVDARAAATGSSRAATIREMLSEALRA